MLYPIELWVQLGRECSLPENKTQASRRGDWNCELAFRHGVERTAILRFCCQYLSLGGGVGEHEAVELAVQWP